MRLIHTFALPVTIFCLLLLPDIAISAPTPTPDRQFSSDTAALSHLFNVAAAKEPLYLILVEKDLQRLRVLEYDTDIRVVAEYPSATGENFGIKEISGDSKTPEGVYFITQIFKDDEITIFGDKAFHLDYPNFFDLEAGRNGDGIYIHGTNKDLELNSTNGCVTLANDDLDNLEKYLTQVVTPVVIVPKINSIRANTHLLTENNFRLAKSLLLLDGINPEEVEYNYLYVINYDGQTVAVSDFIYRPFSRSIMRGASRAYLKNLPGKGWTSAKRIWRASPLQIYPESPIKIAARPFVTDEILLAEQTPQETAELVAALKASSESEKTASAGSQAQPQKVAAVIAPLTAEKPGDTKTVKEGAAKPPENRTVKMEIAKQEAKQPVQRNITEPEATGKKQAKIPVAQSASTSSPRKETERKIAQKQKLKVPAPVAVLNKQQVLDFIEDWRQAWISKQIEPYIAFYDSSFSSGGKNLKQWKSHKARLNDKYSYIAVDISDIIVRWTAAGATVSFTQNYRSDLYSAKGIKTLYLVHNDLGWKISRETFVRI